MANNEGFFKLDPWPKKTGVKPTPGNLQAYSLYYRKDIPVTLSKAPWEKQEENSND
jgi:hypothetical protein